MSLFAPAPSPSASTRPPLALYAIGLGSNRRHPYFGDPRAVLVAAVDALQSDAVEIVDTSRIMSSAPIGPSRRRYANAAILIASPLSPPELLHHLKHIESLFGTRRGQRWSSRVLDLDILLWSEGIWSDDQLNIPHREMLTRNFVLSPLAEITPKWRHPLLQRNIRQILSQLLRRYPVDQQRNTL
jgi:2-amino-4-hydroxy-6-hydroxymethyldihydropteridine diphosphokinase